MNKDRAPTIPVKSNENKETAPRETEIDRKKMNEKFCTRNIGNIHNKQLKYISKNDALSLDKCTRTTANYMHTKEREKS